MKTTTIVTAMLLLAAPASAQTSPYADEAPRSIKALADQEIASLIDGAGMGFARAAELNGVPGPRHSLDMAAQLELDDAQRATLEDVFGRMQAQARRLGTEIVERERELDALFASGTARAEEVRSRSLDLGRLYAELREAHLVAHLETAVILNDHQVARYADLRGYGEADPGGASGHDSHH